MVQQEVIDKRYCQYCGRKMTECLYADGYFFCPVHSHFKRDKEEDGFLSKLDAYMIKKRRGERCLGVKNAEE